MISSTFHCAIIMDGNGRWATNRGLPRSAGHRAGADALRRVVTAAGEAGIAILTTFAFSADNWQRPETEVATLMALLREFLTAETHECVTKGVRLEFIGRRDRLPLELRCAMELAERLTVSCTRLRLRIAIDYSARAAISEGAIGPPVDLLIRTGGEKRLSDFLLWECAYAELIFSPCMWPDFDAHDLAAAMREFRARERRFGRVPAAIANGTAPPCTQARWLD